MKQVIQLDADGYFAGLTTTDESPLEPGVLLIPAGAVDVPVPTILEGQRAKWDGNWVFEDIPQPEPEPETVPTTPTNEEQRSARHYAYWQEADPINFMMQRGEATEQEWLDKIAEIKERYPYYFDDKGNLIEAKA